MTDRLSTLLHVEAEELVIPAPPAGTILSAGRGLRRRRQLRTGLVAAVTVAAATAGALMVVGGDDPEATRFSASGYSAKGALAIDRELYVAGVHVPFDEAVKSFYYAADGVVVRSGKSPWTDDPDVDHFTLVLPDGTKKQLDLSTNDRIVSTEPDSNRLAYADPSGDRWDIVVVDLETGDELSRTTIDGSFTWGGWEAPPVSLDGDVVWSHFDDGWTETNWRTGAVRKVPGTERVSEIANGVYADVTDGFWVVRRMGDGSTVARVPMTDEHYGLFSPDGRFLKVFDQMENDPGADGMYDLGTGERADLPPGHEPWDFGWTPAGDLLVIEDGRVRTCEPATGECEDTDLHVEVGKDSVIKLGGNPYES